MYLWSLQRAGAYGFVPCLIFAVCMALRLARFNAALDTEPDELHAYVYNFFTGVPAPAGAGVVLFPLFLGNLLRCHPFIKTWERCLIHQPQGNSCI